MGGPAGDMQMALQAYDIRDPAHAFPLNSIYLTQLDSSASFTAIRNIGKSDCLHADAKMVKRFYRARLLPQ